MKYFVRRKRPPLALRAVGRLPLTIRRRLLHRATVGEWPNVRDPQSYADLSTALLMGEHDLLTVIAGDKDASKTFVRGMTDEVKVPGTRWLGTDPSTIPDSALKGRWVAKLNAGSGAAAAGEGPQDRPELENFVRAWSLDEAASIFGSTYYSRARAGIIIEDYLDALDARPVELRFYCFGGRAEAAQVFQFDERGNRTDGFLDREGRATDITKRVRGRSTPITADLSAVPAHFARALRVAEVLAEPFAHVRVDLYVVGDDLWFGELTPFPSAGLVTFEPASYDARFVSLWRQALGGGSSEAAHPTPERQFGQS